MHYHTFVTLLAKEHTFVTPHRQWLEYQNLVQLKLQLNLTWWRVYLFIIHILIFLGIHASGSWNLCHNILCHLFNLIFHSPFYLSSYHQGADQSCLFRVFLSGHFWVFQRCLLIFLEAKAHFDYYHHLPFPFQLLCYIWNGLFRIGMKCDRNVCI